MKVYDYIRADRVEVGDLVIYSNDQIEVEHVLDEGDTILVRGYSHISGDKVTYFLLADVEVGLWTES